MDDVSYAYQILREPLLKDKLWPVEGSAPITVTLKDIPIRPAQKAPSKFCRADVGRFDDYLKLATARDVGLVLHHFANHELLAMEIMALAIIKFQDAPANFKVGLRKTLWEERKHLLMYLERMAHCGVEFGEIATSNFFWEFMKSVDSPEEYCAAMSLTFEQANLDFCLHYIGEFRKIGDSVTAGILEKVYKDEISHVNFGYIWLEAACTTDQDFFSYYKSQLRWPISARRAKGKGFDRTGRLKAGLPSEYIDEIENYQMSKGRKPDLFYFNPECERHLIMGRRYGIDKNLALLKTDYQQLMLFLCSQDDWLLVDRIPTAEFCTELRRAGFLVPHFALCKNETDIRQLIKRADTGNFSPFGIDFRLSESGDVAATMPFLSKLWALPLRSKMGVELSSKTQLVDPLFLMKIESLPQLYEILSSLDTVHKCYVLKAPFAANGRDMKRIELDKLGLVPERWIEKMLATHGALILEPWFARLIDIGLVLNCRRLPKNCLLGYHYNLHNRLGQMRRQIFGAQKDTVLADRLRSEVFRPFGLRQLMSLVAVQVCEELNRAGYFGPAGVDLFLYRKLGNLKVMPIAEVNARYTMGHIAEALSKKLSKGSIGVWHHEKKGKEPNRIDKGVEFDKKGKIERGNLCTNDFRQANRFISRLEVLPSDAIRGIITGEDLASWGEEG